MSILPIHLFGDPILRERAAPVERVDRAIRRLIDDMIETMREADGVGLAAPQIGDARRIFVAELDEQVYVFVNPEIVHVSSEMETGDEGCLSLPGYVGEVERHLRVTVRGLDRRRRPHTVVAEGLLARCVQHEIDHLDGILYTDRMEPDAPLYEVVQEQDDADDDAENLEEAQA